MEMRDNGKLAEVADDGVMTGTNAWWGEIGL